ncbi:MAG: sodium-dependent transporter [Synergistales bacterium]|nr:sodium-dependent transporter [Synergistales bacterium]
MSNGEQREQWSGRLGLILAAAGSAVGLGNIWRFSYITGEMGGAAFLLVYLIVIFVIGVSVMVAEFSIGRAAQRNAVGSFKVLKGGAWPIVGWMGVIAGFMILSFYGVIGGWTTPYIFKSFGSMMQQMSGAEIKAAGDMAGELFGGFVSNSVQVIAYQAAFMLVTILVIAKGVAGGIERCCKWLMPGLFVILIVLIIRAVTLEGSGAGLAFYLQPDFSKLNASVFFAALGQAFFTLSLGMGCMITYGSYIGKNEKLPVSAAQVAVLDTSVAFLAGLAIFPIVFAFGIPPSSGPGLTFISLPACFSHMPGGSFWSGLFFLLLFMAGLTSAISLLEVVVAYFRDELGWSRPKATWILGTVIFLIGIPSALSLGGNFPTIMGLSFLDLMDKTTANFLLPLGGLFISLFVGWVWLDGARKEVTNHGKIEFALLGAWVWVCRVIAPVAIAFIFYNKVVGF